MDEQKLPWEQRQPDTCGRPDRPGCGEYIRWVRWPTSGKRMPVDAVASSAGDVIVDRDGDARKLHKGQEYTGPLYVSHFVTCTKRANFRGRQ